MAYDTQKDALECDDRKGIISEYLEKLLPEDWDEMDLYERRSFLSEDDLGAKKGTVKREKVCIVEIWCECFYKERQDLKRKDTYEIECILNRIGGWEKLSSNKSD